MPTAQAPPEASLTGASGSEGGPPRLSICIATRNRAAFIGETLESILAQIEPRVEVVVVDGASSDGTREVLARCAAGRAAVRFFPEPVNSGVDGDYDKAVVRASGTYCWLMTDDDLVAPGAVRRVLEALEDGPALLVVDAEVRTIDMASVLAPRRLAFEGERTYAAGEGDRLLADVGDALTFIGGVVIRRDLWLARDRRPYLGSLFVHVGVIFQAPLGPVKVLGAPLVRIRYGNAGWTSRAFEIWMFRWPELVWSFSGLAAAARAKVCRERPWRSPALLVLHRGLGGYGREEWRRLVAPVAGSGARAVARLVALLPAGAANALFSAWILAGARKARITLYDLLRSPASTWVTRLVARALGVPVPAGVPGGHPPAQDEAA